MAILTLFAIRRTDPSSLHASAPWLAFRSQDDWHRWREGEWTCHTGKYHYSITA